MRRVLFVDDEPHVLEGLRDALRSRRREWSMVFAGSGAAALEELDRHDYDVVVSDMRMPGMDGAALLARVRELQPGTVRLVLSGYADTDVVTRAASVAHRFLAKPCDVGELARVVERSCVICQLGEQQQLRRMATGAARLPCIPAIYQRLSALLAAPDATLDEVAELVERDVAISGRVLQLANSAFFGRSQPITDLQQAVVHLGLNTLKSLVLSAGALGAFEPLASVERFSIEEVRRHGALVAAVARHLLPPGRERDDAVAAALLHDIGVLVMAVEDPEYLGEALAAAEREHRPLAEIEYAERGVSHAEVGAHLLALWGLPHDIVEAVAFHHRPQAAADPILDPVAAVYIADGLVNERAPALREAPPAAADLDAGYLDRLGVADRLPHWRELTARELSRA